MKTHTPRRGPWNAEWGRCPTTGKRSYPSRGLARRAVSIIAAGKGGASLYRCPDCRQYHTSSYPPNVARAMSYLLESLAEDRRKAKRGKK